MLWKCRNMVRKWWNFIIKVSECCLEVGGLCFDLPKWCSENCEMNVWRCVFRVRNVCNCVVKCLNIDLKTRDLYGKPPKSINIIAATRRKTVVTCFQTAAFYVIFSISRMDFAIFASHFRRNEQRNRHKRTHFCRKTNLKPRDLYGKPPFSHRKTAARYHKTAIS